MSKLERRKTCLKLETASTFQGRSIVVEPEPYYIRVRLKGTRKRFTVPWDAVYTLGAKLQARLDRETKKDGRA